MSRIEIPNSLAELRRINRDAYDWYLDLALPTIEQMIQDHSWVFANEYPGLELLLQDGSPWPFLMGFATEANSQFQVTISGYNRSLRPIKGEELPALKNYCHSLEKTQIEGKKIQIMHPVIGLATEYTDPLTIQFPIEPVMKSWIYQ